MNLVENVNDVVTLQRMKRFKYKGSVDTGITLYFGHDFDREKTIHKEHLDQLLKEFKGRKVLIGTSRTNPQDGSLGEWLRANVTRTALASYIAPILIKEGYAYQEDESKMEITFKELY
ncbi:hypothetical protein ACFFHF_12985 [Robertmurraya beringensis]|uniref:Uncharacterized protein n=1 Tax=Robertmurraya beringensis TaxID=641660 RepID=A0ABV6KS53_9BACI